MLPDLNIDSNSVTYTLKGQQNVVRLNHQGTLQQGSRCTAIKIDRPLSVKDGDLSALEGYESSFRRVFWVNNVPAMSLRGNHAHKECIETIFCISGKVDLLLIDSNGHVDFLTLGDFAIVLPPRVWIILRFHSDTSCVMVGCSHEYDAEDYIFDFNFM